MEVKRKDMQHLGWFRILEKRYISKEIVIDNNPGVVSLNIWDKAKEPLIVSNSKYDVKIVDNGYRWIQIALKDKHFWLTAMYDDHNNLIELYFDITRKNYFDDISNPYFDDLFSDIVVTNDKQVLILDEDELDAALLEKVIDKDEYDMVKMTTKELYGYLLENKDYVIDLCNKYLEKLQRELEK